MSTVPVVIEMVILTHSQNFQNCIKKTNKIPEYAREYKKEYLLIIGINKLCFNFLCKYGIDSSNIFVSRLSDKIKYFMNKFLKCQVRGKLKNISSFILRIYDCSHIDTLYKDMKYDFEEDEERSDNIPGYRDFYEIFCKFYGKIKIEDYDDNDYDYDYYYDYMYPVEYYSYLNLNVLNFKDDLLSSEDSEDSDDLLSSEDSEDSDDLISSEDSDIE